ncbi:MAG: hypothetical protein JNJ99_06030, partial [Crocinitomicaceae bacterium]|nr:hypothetical protein [Crocinitomicaceae bacterium]
MKTYSISILILLSLGFNANAQNFAVSDPITVASGYGNYHPQIEVLGDSQLGMIWTNPATNNLYFCKRN